MRESFCNLQIQKAHSETEYERIPKRYRTPQTAFRNGIQLTQKAHSETVSLLEVLPRWEMQFSVEKSGGAVAAAYVVRP
jgi:hypothetical protein